MSMLKTNQTELSQQVIDYLYQCCKSENEIVRKGQAANTDLPVEFLEILADDDSVNVLESVAYNPNSSTDVLYKIYNNLLNIQEPSKTNEQISRIAINILYHRNITLDLFKKIVKNEPGRSNKDQLKPSDKEKAIKRIMQKIVTDPSANPKKLNEFAKVEYSEIRKLVASHKNTEPNTLHELAKDEYSEIRKLVASHKNTEPNTLHELTKDEYSEIRKLVASHKNLGLGDAIFLEENDPNKAVRDRAGGTIAFIENYVPPETVDHSYSNFSGFDSPAEKADHLYGIPDPRLLDD